MDSWVRAMVRRVEMERGGAVGDSGLYSERGKLDQSGLYSAPIDPLKSPNKSPYSAYLHYCLADNLYVQQRLAPGLEEASPGSRLCLHHRDLLTTTTVGQALTMAVQQSRCLIILASQAYFDSSIPGYELQMIMAEVCQQGEYPVVVMTKDEPPSTARAKLREIVGSQADNWTYQPLPLHPPPYDPLVHGSESSSSSGSSRGTLSTVISSPSLRARVTENPLEESAYSQPLLPENIYHTVGDPSDRLIINKRLDIIRLAGVREDRPP